MGGGGRELLRVEDNGEAELMHQPYWIISKAPHIIWRWAPVLLQLTDRSLPRLNGLFFQISIIN